MLNTHALSWFAAAGTLLLAGGAVADEYRLDDGLKEVGVGIQGGGANKSLAWLNKYVSHTALDIVSISAAFGGDMLNTNIPNGTPVTLYIWDDPNQDSDPDDAFVIASITGLVANTGTNILNVYNLVGGVSIPVGRSFFAGAIINYVDPQQDNPLLGSLDEDGTDHPMNFPPNFHSWIAGSANGVPVDPNALALAQLPVDLTANVGLGDGNWMVRLQHIPTPGAITLFGLAALACTRRRR